MADGSRHSLYLTPETVYGETNATPAYETVRITGTTLGLSKDGLESAEIRSDRQTACYRQGANQVGGDINFELSYTSFDTMLEAVLCGTWDANTPQAGTDELKAGVVRRSFTLERLFDDIQTADKPYHRFTGVEFASMNLSITANAMITGTFAVIGQDMTTDTVVIPGSTYIPPTDSCPLDSFTGEIKEGGVTIAVATEITLTLENNMEPRFVVGSKDSLRPSIGRSKLEGNMTAYFENSTLLDKFLDETDSSLEFSLPDTDGNTLSFQIPRVVYSGAQPDVTDEGPITLAMPFMALLDPTSGSNIIITRTPTP